MTSTPLIDAQDQLGAMYLDDRLEFGLLEIWTSHKSWRLRSLCHNPTMYSTPSSLFILRAMPDIATSLWWQWTWFETFSVYNFSIFCYFVAAREHSISISSFLPKVLRSYHLDFLQNLWVPYAALKEVDDLGKNSTCTVVRKTQTNPFLAYHPYSRLKLKPLEPLTWRKHSFPKIQVNPNKNKLPFHQVIINILAKPTIEEEKSSQSHDDPRFPSGRIRYRGRFSECV